MANNKVIDIKDEKMELDKIYDMIIDGQNEGAVVKNQSMNNDCVSEDCSDVDEVIEFESHLRSQQWGWLWKLTNRLGSKRMWGKEVLEFRMQLL